SIGRLADLSWILRLHSNKWNNDPTRSVWQERPMRRACGDILSCSVQSASSAVTGTPNQCHSLIPRVALRPVRLQRPPVPIVILQLHAINVVAVVVLPRSHRGIRRAHHHVHRQHSSPCRGLPCAGSQTREHRPTDARRCGWRCVREIKLADKLHGASD
ncbi:hypothetical protein TcG_12142, partial [Trypanosoma cruzi]